MNQLDPFKQVLMDALSSIGAYAPSILGAIIIMLLGWLVASILRSLVKEVGKKIHFDSWLKKVKADKFFDLQFSLTNLVATVVYWLTYWIFITAAVEQLNIAVVSDGMESILSFFPNIFAALIIMALGFVFGKVSKDVVSHLAQTLKTPHSEGLGDLARVLVVLFAIVIGLSALGVDTRFFTNNFTLLFGGILVWLCVATAVGGKEFCKRMFDQLETLCFNKKKSKK